MMSWLTDRQRGLFQLIKVFSVFPMDHVEHCLRSEASGLGLSTEGPQALSPANASDTDPRIYIVTTKDI